MTMKVKGYQLSEKIYYKYKSPASGYRELTYIKTVGTPQYIDTGVKVGSSVVKFVMDFAYVSGTYFTGAGTGDLGSAGPSIGFGVYESSWSAIEPGSSFNKFGSSTTSRVQFTWTISGNNSTITGHSSNSVSSSSHYGTSCAWRSSSWFIGKATTDSTGNATVTWYSYKVYLDDILVRDFCPCVRVSDNSVGLYDKKNNKFYANAGTGTITGGDLIETEGTASDYDYYKDKGVFKIIKSPARRYYKYVDEAWSYPYLSDNTSWGTVTKMDNDDNIISDSSIYKAFNGSTAAGGTNTYEFWGRTSFRIKWTMPEKVKVTSIQMWGQNAADTYYSVTGFTAWAWDYDTEAYVQLCTGSYGAEGSTYGSWTVTPIETDIFRFYVAGYPSDPGYRPTALREIALAGTHKVLTRGTASDYDFYVDTQSAYYAPKTRT